MLTALSATTPPSCSLSRNLAAEVEAQGQHQQISWAGERQLGRQLQGRHGFLQQLQPRHNQSSAIEQTGRLRHLAW